MDKAEYYLILPRYNKRDKYKKEVRFFVLVSFSFLFFKMLVELVYLFFMSQLCQSSFGLLFFCMFGNDRGYEHLAVCGSIRCRDSDKMNAGAKC